MFEIICNVDKIPQFILCALSIGFTAYTTSSVDPIHSSRGYAHCLLIVGIELSKPRTFTSFIHINVKISSLKKQWNCFYMPMQCCSCSCSSFAKGKRKRSSSGHPLITAFSSNSSMLWRIFWAKSNFCSHGSHFKHWQLKRFSSTSSCFWIETRRFRLLLF